MTKLSSIIDRAMGKLLLIWHEMKRACFSPQVLPKIPVKVPFLEM